MKKVLALLVVLLLGSLLLFPQVSIALPQTHPCNLKPSPAGHYPKVSIEQVNRKLKTIYGSSSSIPSEVDWSNGEPPVGDQGQQGSCVAWATGYYYKTYQEGKEHNWDLSTPNHQFSPAFIYNQINGGQDNGSTIADAMKLIRQKGCDTLSEFPYSDTDYTTQPTETQLQEALPYRSVGYSEFFSGQGNANIDELKKYLATGDTIVFAIPVYSNFMYAPDDPNYVVGTKKKGRYFGGHAIQCVGYNDSLKAFKIINSWGTGWGYNGYTNVSYDFIQQYAWEAWCMDDAVNDSTDGFTVTSTPNDFTLANGQSDTGTISIEQSGSFNSEVSLSAQNLPAGIDVNFSPAAILPYETSTMTVNVGSNVNAGDYAFNVVGTSGNITNSATITIHVSNSAGPSAPTNLVAVTGKGKGSIDLSWNASSDNVAEYNIYMGSSPGGESTTPLNSSLITKTSFTVRNLQSGVTYYFVVKAVDSNGNLSDPSNEASAKAK
jgi:C1A family cysteine protease